MEEYTIGDLVSVRPYRGSFEPVSWWRWYLDAGDAIAANCQDLHRGRLRKDGLDQVGDGITQVLAVVDHQQPDPALHGGGDTVADTLAWLLWVMPSTAATSFSSISRPWCVCIARTATTAPLMTSNRSPVNPR
jgi:hypothetical protein